MKAANLPIPHNEALGYRLYRLTLSLTATLLEEEVGEDKAQAKKQAEAKALAKTIEIWAEVLSKESKPTVAQINSLVKTPKPEPQPATARRWLGKAVSALQEAVNLAKPEDMGDLISDAEQLLNKLRSASAIKMAA